MIVSKRFNNNVILARSKQQEVILMGKGIGFQVYPDEEVQMELIEQTFVPSDSFMIESVAELLGDSNSKEVSLVREIIDYGEKVLAKELNDSLVITLLDHLHFAIVRHEKEMITKSPIEWEIKQMYRVETKIGLEALRIIHERLGIVLPKSEAIFIAMHFINGQFKNETMSDTLAFSETMNQVNSIVKYHFQIRIDEESVNYQRFLTHLRYYLIRQKNHESLELGNEDVYFTMKERFPEESNCVEKISTFIEGKYEWQTTYDEKLYLILHVNRLIS
ncbi:PRD domain-containing protein [Vagococcus sp. BWB3-3]|uniref:PRD domain-containing protein n=1 Tax=Vagococcus allomyrinae TaxID=2794353 RepID=A0A940PAL8_9ENTE|nr:PRD domain-containing protein [Vagococcus allomyrinae]MBP1044347.1 PRD domain-containing protein [Vagococcus allomyrinae]